jgi:hypothetical protein
LERTAKGFPDLSGLENLPIIFAVIVRLLALVGGLVVLLAGCRESPTESASGLAERLARDLDEDLRVIRLEAENLSKKVEGLYERREELVGQARKEDYAMTSGGAFYKVADDGGTALWISGVVPVTEEIKEVAYLTEPLDEILPEIHRRHPVVVQSYYNDRHSLNRIYPWFDPLSQYPPKMDIPSFSFYFLADAKHNPERKGVWVAEPYIDPAGRGWMVSAIAPTYYENELVGVPGLDITLETLLEEYFAGLEKSVVLVMSASGTVVMATEPAIGLFALPPLQSHKYLETVKEDTFRPEDYNLFNCQNREARLVLRRLVEKGALAEPVTLDFPEGKFELEAAGVPEMGWWVLHLLKTG